MLNPLRYISQDGISIVGFIVLGAALFVLPIYFPQWGSMLFSADRRPTSTEEEYYAGEYRSVDPPLLDSQLILYLRSQSCRRFIPASKTLF